MKFEHVYKGPHGRFTQQSDDPDGPEVATDGGVRGVKIATRDLDAIRAKELAKKTAPKT